MKGTAGCLAEGSKLQIFLSFRVFRTESQSHRVGRKKSPYKRNHTAIILNEEYII